MRSNAESFKMAKSKILTDQATRCHHFDESMFEFISILKFAGFQIVDFCQGHLDELQKPDLNFKSPITHLEQRIKKATSFYPYVEFNMRKTPTKSIAKFLDSLEEFYQNRKTSYKYFLMVEPYNTYNHKIKPMSGDIDSLITDKLEQEKIYKRYHKEINDFVVFFKQKYNLED